MAHTEHWRSMSFFFIKGLQAPHQILFLLSQDVSADNYFNYDSSKDRDNVCV